MALLISEEAGFITGQNFVSAFRTPHSAFGAEPAARCLLRLPLCALLFAPLVDHSTNWLLDTSELPAAICQLPASVYGSRLSPQGFPARLSVLRSPL